MGPAAETLRVWWWAATTGALSAAAVVGFRWLTQWVEELATGRRGGRVEAALSLSPWHRALICTTGGFLAGLVLQGGTAWARRDPGGAVKLDCIDDARAGRVDLNDRTMLTRTVSALFSRRHGRFHRTRRADGSIGRLGRARLARFVSTAPEQRNTLLVCGIAAGIGSAYHAPIACVVFVLELELGFLARHTIAPG